jgi:hypothetical protein
VQQPGKVGRPAGCRRACFTALRTQGLSGPLRPGKGLARGGPDAASLRYSLLPPKQLLLLPHCQPAAAAETLLQLSRCLLRCCSPSLSCPLRVAAPPCFDGAPPFLPPPCRRST